MARVLQTGAAMSLPNYRTPTLALLGVLLLSAPASRAITITNTVTLNLSGVSISNDGSGGKLILGNISTPVAIPSFAPSVGDILVTSVSFANGDSLKITGGPNVVDSSAPTYFSSLVFFFSTASGSYTTNTTAVTYSNLVGTALPGFGTSGILGQALMGNLSLGQSVSFSGLTLTSTITGISGTPSSATQFGLFGGRAGNYEVVSAPVPDTGSTAWLSLAVGVTLLGLRARKPERVRS